MRPKTLVTGANGRTGSNLCRFLADRDVSTRGMYCPPDGGTDKYVFRKALAMIVPERFRRVPKRPQRMKYDLEFA